MIQSGRTRLCMALPTHSPPILSLLAFVQLGALCALAIRLTFSSLFRTYRWFTVYLLFELIRAVITRILQNGTTAYAYFYLTTQPVFWALQVLVILESFQLALKRHTGIATFGRRALSWALIISTLLALGSLYFTRNVATSSSASILLETVFTLERVISLSLSLFVLVFLAILRHFPVPLSHNALVHASVFGLYFVAKTAIMLVRNIWGNQVQVEVNISLMVLSATCLMVWTVMLTRQGESEPTVSRARVDEEQQQRLMAQLDALNRTLLNSAKD
jgi:hypothetical protein